MVAVLIFSIFPAVSAYAQEGVGMEGEAPGAVLFQNVRVFDGTSDHLDDGVSVLVVGNSIAEIGGGGDFDVPEDVLIIEGGGRVLMPGLIDAHWHTFMARPSYVDLLKADVGYLHSLAAVEAEATLMRGFTTARDVEGPSFGLKRAIDEGVVVGPRIYPSGASITQTSGHGDDRYRHDIPRRHGGNYSRWEELGVSLIADGEAEVLTAVREQLRMGATQIKIMGGGGVASVYDPIDTVQFTLEEMKAAVKAAADWGTYVCVHVYNSKGIRRAVEAGIKCIEHGHLIDEETIKLLAEKDVWLSTQPFMATDNIELDESHLVKWRQVSAGTDRIYRLARKYGVKLAFGTDKVFSKEEAAAQNEGLIKLLKWFEPVEILQMATGTNGELVALCGLRNPYPKKLGVIEIGAYADLLLVDGNPLEDLALLAEPERNLAIIMKDGKIYKNKL